MRGRVWSHGRLWSAGHARRVRRALVRDDDDGTIGGLHPDMRPLPLARPAPADLPPWRCPDCGQALAADVDAPSRCGCGADVGATFRDGRGRRLPVRAVFVTTAEPACAACGGVRRRVLIGEDVGVACDGCGVLVRRPRRRHLAPPPGSRRGLIGELLLVAALLAGVAALVATLWPLRAG